jgi:hypothetical protein
MRSRHDLVVFLGSRNDIPGDAKDEILRLIREDEAQQPEPRSSDYGWVVVVGLLVHRLERARLVAETFTRSDFGTLDARDLKYVRDQLELAIELLDRLAARKG